MSPIGRKIAVAGIYHETNSFAPGWTDNQDFAAEWTDGPEAFFSRYEGTRTSMGGVIEAARQCGAQLLPGVYAAATPSGMVRRDTAEWLLDAVTASVRPDADGLVLILHGAMASESFDDPEGECLRRLRSRLGERFPIAVTLDLHANITPAMAEGADLIIGYDTYPHTDMFERAEEAFRLLIRLVQREIRPVRAYAHSGMLIVPQGMMTGEEPMKALMDRALVIESDPRVLNVTVAGGFPYCDMPYAGMSVVVTTDGEPGLAGRYAAELTRLAWERREQFAVRFMSPDRAVSAALAEPEGPVILAEGSDNVGGGAPGDATHVLALLAEAPVKSLMVICDPEAVRDAHEAGVGGTFSGRVGGKTGGLHGRPVMLTGRVRLLSDGRYRHAGPYMTGHQADMGRTAVVECGLLTVVLTGKRTAPWDIGHLHSVGISPGDYRIITVKSAVAWQTALGSFAKRVIQLDTPGCCAPNLNHLEYRNLRRPVYPLDEFRKTQDLEGINLFDREGFRCP